MYEEIDQLIDAIKQESWYQAYLQAYEKVMQNQTLHDELKTMQRLLDERNEQKKYAAYISLKEIDDRIAAERKILSDAPEYQHYQQALFTLNEHLDAISHLVFDGISEELNIGRMGKLYARHSR